LGSLAGFVLSLVWRSFAFAPCCARIFKKGALRTCRNKPRIDFLHLSCRQRENETLWKHKTLSRLKSHILTDGA